VATCLAYVIGNILIINWYYHKKIGIDIPLFWKNILKMSPVMFLMGTVWWFLLDGVVFSGWLMFLGYAVVYLVMYAVLAYLFMMNGYEKELLTGPIKKIFKKLSRR
jgi:O-antigen/teichoic acid export membrane protein